MPENRFLTALRAGQSQIGIWCTIPGPVVAEVLAGCGYDWILLDCEHALTDVPDILPMLQAVSAYPVQPVVRPASHDPAVIKRLLDHGAQTLLIPFVQSAEEARALVRATRYAPAGTRGVSWLTRAGSYGGDPDYVARANDQICLLVQVETPEAVDRIEEIAAVDGVEGIFVGPADLAAAMGHPGNAAHPDVVARVDQALTRIRAAGKPAGILTLDADRIRRALDLGSSFTAVGVDIALLRGSAAALARAQGRGKDEGGPRYG